MEKNVLTGKCGFTRIEIFCGNMLILIKIFDFSQGKIRLRMKIQSKAKYFIKFQSECFILKNLKSKGKFLVKIPFQRGEGGDWGPRWLLGPNARSTWTAALRHGPPCPQHVWVPPEKMASQSTHSLPLLMQLPSSQWGQEAIFGVLQAMPSFPRTRALMPGMAREYSCYSYNSHLLLFPPHCPLFPLISHPNLSTG